MAHRRPSYWRRRILRHLALALASVLLTTGIFLLLTRKDPIHDVSLASAYVALILLGLSLAIGPWNVLRRRANPVSSDLRRDVGIWAGVLGLFHLVIGLDVHLRGRPWLYFVYPADQPHDVPVRHDLFGFANFTGLVAGLVLLLLLVLSNDLSLARLGTRRWKALQRFNYYAAALVVAHSIAYQFIEKRIHLPALLVTFAVVVLVVAGLQLRGMGRVREGGGRAPVARAREGVAAGLPSPDPVDL
jgi:sulfoxide reductase heme-binding subunit YedZ